MKKPNLLFFGIDSLRRDRMSLYGYERLTTPHIDEYLKGGTVFEQCFSASIPTTSGYSCMLTGRDCFGTNVVALRHEGDIASGVPTLAKVLEAEGYNTTCVGFSGNAGGKGFQNYIEFAGWGAYADGRARKAENLNEVAIPELKRLAKEDKPFFLFMRHMDPHSPYLPPEPYERMFYAGDELDPDNHSLDECLTFKPFCDYFASWFPPQCTSDEYICAQYDSEVTYMDACIQSILTQLNELGLEDDTLVVFVSDHGETLNEHHCYFDHHGLYDCTLTVPFALRFPGHVPAGKRIPDIMTLSDVMPTILDVLGVDKSRLTMDGRSMFGRMFGEAREVTPEFYITECTWERKHGWRTPRYKLIEALEPDFHFREMVELYDLLLDPGENNNIAEKEPELVKYYHDKMMAHIAKREKEVGRKNPMYTNLDWHGIKGRGPFATSQEAYDTMHIGDVGAAQKLQNKTAEEKGK